MGEKKPGRRRIDVLLVDLGLCESRTKAAARVLAGEVVVGDHRVDKPGDLVDVTAEVRLKGEADPYVSRGGKKLEGALAAWDVPVEGAVCLDVGASTGGFTDLLLRRGAARVYAVDVGYGQLAHKLRVDPRVVNLERTHIARLPVGALVPPPTLCVVDVSFISLRLVLPAIVPHLAAAAFVVLLVKPQFEVGRGNVGKGGIVKDDALRRKALDDVLAAAQGLGLTVVGTRESPLPGADGNREWLAALRRP